MFQFPDLHHTIIYLKLVLPVGWGLYRLLLWSIMDSSKSPRTQ
jgi:hypothetical protein